MLSGFFEFRRATNRVQGMSSILESASVSDQS